MRHDNQAQSTKMFLAIAPCIRPSNTGFGPFPFLDACLVHLETAEALEALEASAPKYLGTLVLLEMLNMDA